MFTSATEAAVVLQRAYRGYRQRRVFRILRAALCRAEQCVTADVLRRVAPAEAALLADPAIEARVRFRLGGARFPPTIYFKVFTAGRVRYMAGEHYINGATAASYEAMRLMGASRYMEIVVQDECIAESLGGGVPVTAKDYLRLRAERDRRSVLAGGRGNDWRPLFSEAESLGENLHRFHLVEGPLPFPSLMERVLAEKQGWLDAAERVALLLERTGGQQVHVPPQMLASFKQKQRREKTRRMRQLYLSHLHAGASSAPSALEPGAEGDVDGASDDDGGDAVDTASGGLHGRPLFADPLFASLHAGQVSSAASRLDALVGSTAAAQQHSGALRHPALAAVAGGGAGSSSSAAPHSSPSSYRHAVPAPSPDALGAGARIADASDDLDEGTGDVSASVLGDDQLVAWAAGLDANALV